MKSNAFPSKRSSLDNSVKDGKSMSSNYLDKFTEENSVQDTRNSLILGSNAKKNPTTMNLRYKEVSRLSGSRI